VFLDVSDNQPLRHLDELVAALPSSLRFVKCGGCGAARDAVEYRQALVATLPVLRTLDDEDVTWEERRAAREAFGEDPDTSDEEEEEGEERGEEGVGAGLRWSSLEDAAARGIAQLDIDDDENSRVQGDAGEAGAAAAAGGALAAANKARAAAARPTAAAATAGL
jgi:hypothetical protein